ncbi:hypothetical protein PV326_009494 [Microctonus aethiopoides]|nr:hypothetical protein PV326_009494 [Microctonus aethiopoides]
MGIDRMHGCDDGVVKKLMTLFFDTKYRNYPFSLCTALNIINSRLTAIKPPKFIHLPILEGVMRADYFENYMRLMFALAILSYESISLEMIQTAQDLLHRFVREFQILYGIHCNMGCNTCYEYENINGQLLKLIHGTWHIDTQIANSQYEFIKMNRLIGLLSEGNIRNFCLRRKRQVKITEQLQERCYRTIEE